MSDYSEVVCDGSDGGRTFEEYCEAMRSSTFSLIPKETIPEVPYQAIEDHFEYEDEVVDDYMDDLNMLIDEKYEGERLSFGFHPDLPGCLMLAGDEWWNPEEEEYPVVNVSDEEQRKAEEVWMQNEAIGFATMTELW